MIGDGLKDVPCIAGSHQQYPSLFADRADFWKGWYVLGGAATCSEGFVIRFRKVGLVCLDSMAAAVQPNSLRNSQKKVNKTFGRSGRPTGYSVCNILHTL